MTGRRRRARSSTPEGHPEDRFIVRADDRVKDRVADAKTPREVKDAYKDAVRALRKRGCAAADKRLSGPVPWPHFCSMRLPRGYRLVMTFPYPDEVVLELLHPHTQRDDPARLLVELFDLPAVDDLSDWRDEKEPPCCKPDGTPPGA